MALSSFVEARDEILTLFRTAWIAQAPPVPPVIYGDIESDPPKDGTAWATAKVLHSISNQATLGESGNRRFRRHGLVVINIYTPAGDGLVAADAMSKVALDAFEGKTSASGSIWFKNVHMSEGGQDGNWHNSQVMAEFEYDEVK